MSTELGTGSAAVGPAESVREGPAGEPRWLGGQNRVTSKIARPEANPTAIARDIHRDAWGAGLGSSPGNTADRTSSLTTSGSGGAGLTSKDSSAANCWSASSTSARNSTPGGDDSALRAAILISLGSPGGYPVRQRWPQASANVAYSHIPRTGARSGTESSQRLTLLRRVRFIALPTRSHHASPTHQIEDSRIDNPPVAY